MDYPREMHELSGIPVAVFLQEFLVLTILVRPQICVALGALHSILLQQFCMRMSSFLLLQMTPGKQQAVNTLDFVAQKECKVSREDSTCETHKSITESSFGPRIFGFTSSLK